MTESVCRLERSVGLGKEVGWREGSGTPAIALSPVHLHSARSVRRTWGEKRALRGCDVLKENIMQNEV